jgi:integrase
MSVYKPKKSPFYHYDFQHRGIRFAGSTGCASKRDAEAFERAKKDEAHVQALTLAAQASAPMALAPAAARYYVEHGQYFRGHGPKELQRFIRWLERELGPHTLLSSIDNDQVAQLVAIRRGEGVEPATVNRSVTEPLRKILFRARDMWGQQIRKIDWKRHMLKEPQERVRVLGAEEEVRLFDKLRMDYHAVVRFALASGCRVSEIVPGKYSTGLKWADIDWGARTITVRGKGGKIDTIPVSPGLRKLLFPLRGQHPEYVFTYVCQRQGKDRMPGQRYPITREGLRTEWRRAKIDARIVDYRFHDNRHTAATDVLRATGNLKIVQKLLRHADITTTTKYAHVLDDDVRQAMEAAEKSRTKSRTAATKATKRMKEKD